MQTQDGRFGRVRKSSGGAGLRFSDCRVYFHSSEAMPEISDNKVKAAIASPPYTNSSDGKFLDKGNYFGLLARVLSESFRVLEPGGVFVCVNTDLRDHARYNGGDKSFEGLVWQKHADLRRLAETQGFRCVDTKIWAKSLGRTLCRYTFAYIQFFQKPRSDRRAVSCRWRTAAAFAADVWLLPGGTLRRGARGSIFLDAMHPEIAVRCLHQFTAPGDLVLCPFAGSGTVLSVAKQMGRCGVGYEIDAKLRDLIAESVVHPERLPGYRVSWKESL